MKISVLVLAVGLGISPVMAQTPFAQSAFSATAIVIPRSRIGLPARPVVPAESGHDGRTLYRASVVAVVAANALDTLSSWQRPEANLLLSSPGTKFGTKALMVKSGFAGASLLIEALALRHNPGLYRKVAWLNFAVAGGLTMTATYNFSLH